MKLPRAAIGLLPALTVLATVAGCTSDAAPQYRVPDLRILAIRSNLPSPSTAADPDVGETVTLEALVANPRARSPVAVDWFACAPPIPGSLSPCLDPERLLEPDALPSVPGVVTIAVGATVTGGVSTIQLDLLAHQADLEILGARDVVVAASQSPALQCRLYAELPIVAVVRAPGIAETAVKRVRFHPLSALAALSDPTVNHYDLNLNPGIAGVLAGASDPGLCADGTPLASVTLGGEVELCGSLTGGSIGQYEQCDADGARTRLDEEIEWQWYVSAGEIAEADFDGNATGRHVKLTPASGSSTLWLIARDGRGGTGWSSWELVAP